LDNAKYHNVFTENTFPVSTTQKEALCDWRERNNIPWTADMLKPALYELCKRFAPVHNTNLIK